LTPRHTRTYDRFRWSPVAGGQARARATPPGRGLGPGPVRTECWRRQWNCDPLHRLPAGFNVMLSDRLPRGRASPDLRRPQPALTACDGLRTITYV